MILISQLHLCLIRKTWDDRFTDKVGGMEDFKKWVDPSNGGMILKWWIDTTLRAMERLLLYLKSMLFIHFLL